MTTSRFNWDGPGIEITSAPDPIDLTGTEEKGGVRTVKDPAYWGLPFGTPITPGMKPKTSDPKPAKKGPSVTSNRRTGGTGKTTADKPVTTPRAPKKETLPVLDRATGLLRAWGSSEDAPDVRRKHHADRRVEYVKPAELEKGRRVAVQRARTLAPVPEKKVIARNKFIIKKYGGPGTGGGDLRGDMYQRSQRSWDMYVAFGGIDPKTGKDKGYVPCLGCGVKMTWHDDEEFSNYPKFEQDKIITTGDGGSYNAQNCVPKCAGCNSQRGNKKLWESPVFAEAKPPWYDAKFEKLIAATRPNEATDFSRPATMNAEWMMPVPPGKVRGARSVKSDALDRATNMFLVTDSTETTSVGTNGDRVQANLFNFDGRHNDAECNVFPPDVDNVDRKVVGRLVVREVESDFGTYTQHFVIGDDGRIVFVEENTIEKVANAPDFDDDAAFSDDTNGTGGGGGGIGRRSPRGPNRERGLRTGEYFLKAERLLRDLEEKKRRYVRTPEGAARFGKPVGSLITPADLKKLKDKRRESGVAKKVSEARYKPTMGIAYADRIDKKQKPTRKEVNDFTKRVGDAKKIEDSFVGVMDHDFGSRYTLNQYNYMSDYPFVATWTMTAPNGQELVQREFKGNTQKEAFELMASAVQRKYNRLRVKGTDYDADGYYPRNETKRDYKALPEHYWGVRGSDWMAEGDENYGDDYDSRKALIDAEAESMGYMWGKKGHPRLDRDYDRYPIALWAQEEMNAVMRGHEEMYPGFAQLHSTVVSDLNNRGAVAWNGTYTVHDPEREGFNNITVLGMNPEYFGDMLDEDAQKRAARRVAEAGARIGGKATINHFSVSSEEVSKKMGIDLAQASVVTVMTHELGHTVGNILQNRIIKDGDLANKPNWQDEDPMQSVGNYFREDLMDLLFEYNILSKDIDGDDDQYGQSKWARTERAINDPEFNEAYFDRAAVAEHVSVYASTNMPEIFAETWAAYQLSDQPGQFVRELGGLMEQALTMFLDEETGERETRKQVKSHVIGVTYS